MGAQRATRAEGRPGTVGPLSRLGLGLAIALALAPASTRAAPPLVTPAPAPIHGGAEAEICAFPTAVALYENMVLCSGTLVAPRLVLTAAHCIGGGPGPSVISFGESIFEPTRTAAVDHCLANPASPGGLGPWDYAYCLLAEPVDDIPPTPILMGCETDILRYGQEVRIAGYGATDLDVSGIKHVGATIVDSEAAGDVVLVGADGTAACSGDSGGPAYVQLADGGWRAFGIVSGGVSCEESVTYVTMHSMIGWAEEQTGLDFTPCHDADGTWNPGPDCGGASIEADAPSFDWPSCAGARTGPSSTCGPAFASEADVDGPDVAITSPLDAEAFAGVPATFDILVDAADVSSEGQASGVERVEFYVDDILIATDDRPPWAVVDASFVAGSWTLEARAFDWRGNEGRSEPVTIHVGEVADDTGEDTGTTESESGASETGDGPTPSDPDAGCSCRSDGEPAPTSIWLLGLGLVLARRQRAGIGARPRA